MSDIPLYELEPYRTEVDTVVVGAGADEHGYYAGIRELLFYPEGGGQPADRGWLGDVPVEGALRVSGEVRLRTAAPVPVGPVTARLDWERRFDHMQQHTAQHLITALAQDRFGWPTTAFHLGDDLCDIELDVPTIGRGALDELEDLVATKVHAAARVSARRVGAEQLSSLGVRTRGLPEGHTGDVRLVEIEGLDLNTCGGTHVRSTSELEAVKLLHTEAMRGGTRVFFVAGGRLRRRLASHEQRSSELRRALGAADDELVRIATQRGERVKELERLLRRADDELAVLWADVVAARAEGFVDLRFEDRPPAFLLAVARAFVSRNAGATILLTSTLEQGGAFVLASGEASPLDVAATGAEVATILSGRGGGQGRIFQGKAEAPNRHDDAAQLVRARLGGTTAGG